VRQLAGYYRRLEAARGSRETLARQHPLLEAARSLWETPEMQQQLVLLILGRCDRPLIAVRLNIDPEVLLTLEALYFDVRDRLEAIGWLNVHVLLPAQRSGPASLAMKYRSALSGGPLVALSLLEAGPRFDADEAARLAERERQLESKVHEALAVPLTDGQQAVRLLKAFFDYDLKNQNLELARQQFRHRCECELGRHEQAAHDREAACQARQAARDRARASPLAQLTWHLPGSAQPAAHNRDGGALDQPGAGETGERSIPLKQGPCAA
jgi:hypothetical protein